MRDRPNILFFFTDDQRFDTIAALGHPRISTPNLDALVDRGTTFTHARIPGGTCPAVCMPSRAMLHSGRSLFRIHDIGGDIPSEHATLGETLRSEGYQCFGTGKWHNGEAAFARGFDCGDEIFFGGMVDHWNVPAHRYDPSGRYSSRLPHVKDPAYSNEVSWRSGDHVAAGVHSTELLTDATLRFLNERDGERPFFAYVSLLAPHDPRTMPEEFRAMYDPDDIPLPANFMAEHPFDNGALRIRDEVLADFPRKPAEIKRHIAEYCAMITHLDHHLGRLIDGIERHGLLDNTIVVFAGDNGLAVGQHGLMGKQNLYDHSVRVPLIFAGPGVEAGARSEAAAYLFDVFPTLCDLVGAETPETVEGISLAGCLRGSDEPVRESLYLAYESSMRGVQKGDYKLIKTVQNGIRTTQLFNLADDPLEMHNLSHHDGAVETINELRTELFRLRDEWGDREHPTGAAFWSAYEAAEAV